MSESSSAGRRSMQCLFLVLWYVVTLIICAFMLRMSHRSVSVPFTIAGGMLCFIATSLVCCCESRKKSDRSADIYSDAPFSYRNSFSRSSQVQDTARNPMARPQPTNPSLGLVHTSDHSYINPVADVINPPVHPTRNSPGITQEASTYDASKDLPPTYESVVKVTDEAAYARILAEMKVPASNTND